MVGGKEERKYVLEPFVMSLRTDESGFMLESFRDSGGMPYSRTMRG